jgi:hypothetical protein
MPGLGIGAKPKMITFWSRVASTRRRFSACRGNRSEKVIEKGDERAGGEQANPPRGHQLLHLVSVVATVSSSQPGEQALANPEVSNGDEGRDGAERYDDAKADVAQAARRDRDRQSTENRREVMTTRSANVSPDQSSIPRPPHRGRSSRWGGHDRLCHRAVTHAIVTGLHP